MELAHIIIALGTLLTLYQFYVTMRVAKFVGYSASQNNANRAGVAFLSSEP